MFDDSESELDKVLGNAMRRPLDDTIKALNKELTSRWPTVENLALKVEELQRESRWPTVDDLVVEVRDLRTTVDQLSARVGTSAGDDDARQQHVDRVLSGVAGWIASAASSLRDLEAARKVQEEAVSGLLIRTHRKEVDLRRLVKMLSLTVAVQLAACVAVVAVVLTR